MFVFFICFLGTAPRVIKIYKSLSEEFLKKFDNVKFFQKLFFEKSPNEFDFLKSLIERKNNQEL